MNMSQSFNWTNVTIDTLLILSLQKIMIGPDPVA